MQNPFETGHIKNYILAYVSVVVIMVLFFVATTLFNDMKIVQQKHFYVDKNVTKMLAQKKDINIEKNITLPLQHKFKLLEKGY